MVVVTAMKMENTINLGAPHGVMRITEFIYPPVMIPGVMRIVDCVMIGASGLLTLAFMPVAATQTFNLSSVCIIFVMLSYFMLASMSGLFSLSAVTRPVSRADDVVVSLAAAFLLFLSMALGLDVWSQYSGRWVAVFAAVSLAAVLAGRMGGWRVLRHLARRGVIGRSMVVLGVGEQSRRFLRRFRETNPYFFSVAGVFYSQRSDGVGHNMIEGYPVLGDVDALLACARAHKIDDVVVAMPWSADRQVIATVESLKELPINVHLSTDLIGYELAFRPALGDFHDLPLFEVVQRPISGWGAALKMIEDYLLASVLLIMISPLLAVIAVAIKLDSPGPVLFKQKRLGFNNREFHIYKFRSMYHRDAPEIVVQQASRRDPRVTRVGRFIRAASIDELPQLLNVLDGTMSLVGPRPHALSHNEEYGRLIRGYFSRHRVKPGITGWAQVHGLRGETKELGKMESRVRYDIHYANNWSLFLDLRILIMTLFVVPFQRSAY